MPARGGLGVQCKGFGLPQARHACRRRIACAAAERKKAANDRALERYLRNRVKELGTFVPPPPGSTAGFAAGGPQQQQQQMLPPPDTAVLLAFLRRQLAEGISNEAEPLPRTELLEARSNRREGEAAEGAAKTQGRGGKKAVTGGARKGVVVLQPEPYPVERRTLPLPGDIAPPPSGPPAAALAPAAAPSTRLVHVFWDVESAHPGDDRDPRLAAAELLRLARRLAEPSPAASGDGTGDGGVMTVGASRGGASSGVRGRVVGAYAYANRPGWTWLPAAFLNAYAGTTVITAGASGSSGSGADGGGSGATSDSEAGSGVGAASSGAGGRNGGGRPRCPVCGRQVAPAKMAAHIRQLHPDQPAAEALAEAAVARHAAAAAGDADAANYAAAAEAEALAAGGGPASPSSARRRAAADGSNSSRSSGGGGGGASRSRSRGNPSLGAVAAYYSSDGRLYRPPAGHQLVLKYVLAREGFEPRVVQNADGAADRALNGGIDRLLAAMRNAGSRAGGSARVLRMGGGAEAAAGAAEVTVVLVSGSRRHGPALNSCRRLGVRTVLVAPRRLLAALEAEREEKREKEAQAGAEAGAKGKGRGRRAAADADGATSGGVGGADVVVEWEALAGGRYMLL
ncbi:hypothetical protein CHLRE_12g524250v5 [Chlamydomonas reinhardtii]|uniref:Uncharacterized protein n=1 Tax=Chlamydomonas reinhardtii TaxID=3055 RepID=A0A2K3D4A2_CHLRE|nr:uncharacterized protein CHLRE_12g524250v5 [Chlamydomonas reinhardtii]PNW75368.1 hypothetical protein CHLRE_12g524250v5 [Chlamydomonas reinhardtii]